MRLEREKRGHGVYGTGPLGPQSSPRGPLATLERAAWFRREESGRLWGPALTPSAGAGSRLTFSARVAHATLRLVVRGHLRFLRMAVEKGQRGHAINKEILYSIAYYALE